MIGNGANDRWWYVRVTGIFSVDVRKKLVVEFRIGETLGDSNKQVVYITEQAVHVPELIKDILKMPVKFLQVIGQRYHGSGFRGRRVHSWWCSLYWLRILPSFEKDPSSSHEASVIGYPSHLT